MSPEQKQNYPIKSPMDEFNKNTTNVSEHHKKEKMESFLEDDDDDDDDLNDDDDENITDPLDEMKDLADLTLNNENNVNVEEQNKNNNDNNQIGGGGGDNNFTMEINNSDEINMPRSEPDHADDWQFYS